MKILATLAGCSPGFYPDMSFCTLRHQAHTKVTLPTSCKISVFFDKFGSPEYVIVSGDKSTLIMRPVFGEYYIQQTWPPTCSYASTPWCPDPKLSYGTRLPRTVNKGLTAIRALYRHILEIHKKKQKNSAVGCLLCSCSYHSLGANNIGPNISSKSDLWLAVYPDQVAIRAYFVPWAG